MIRYGGASQIGKTHIMSKLPNQDSLLIYRSKKRKKEVVLTLADGLGSHKHSQIGSLAITEAVKCNAHILNNESKKDLFIKKVMAKYKKLISPYDISECGTTCIFAIIFREKVCFGQIGDGICCYKINDNFKILQEKDSAFLNETVSVTSKNSEKKWVISYEKNYSHLQIMLATDGVADDLVDDMREVFLQRLCDNTIGYNSQKINKLISSLFDNWERPFSYDDKTMILCFKENKK